MKLSASAGLPAAQTQQCANKLLFMARAAKRSKAGKQVQEPVQLQENIQIQGAIEMEGAEVMAIRLHEAIRAHALNLVQDYLDAGVDANLGPALGSFVQPECDKKG